ncbi:NfeD family protein [Nocardioides rotundus]|uniref:NfeD family protein n=1 Tax=Nocardioides rotundus TaxID=1774216 RepID=UPI001CBF7B11|nr:NfeD family protein [Nocardioides rotundus]UAL31578.1 NfeD family protein [Nocardioides rotundus]
MDWFQDWQGWLGVAIVLAGLEMLSLDLILIMLAAGAVAGMVMAIIGLPFAVQALVAAGTALAMLAFVRPSMARRMHGGPDLEIGHGKLVGTQGTVTERITGLEPGRVRLSGEIWSALPYDETLVIEADTPVEVLEIRGATAYVHPVPTLEG